jgi:rhodanese-related sulfurtransferase
MEPIIIDVREPFEYKMGHVKGAINIPPAKLMRGLPSELGDTPKDAEIILYCLSGARSRAAIHILEQHGFTNLTNGINKDHVNARLAN